MDELRESSAMQGSCFSTILGAIPRKTINHAPDLLHGRPCMEACPLLFHQADVHNVSGARRINNQRNNRGPSVQAPCLKLPLSSCIFSRTTDLRSSGAQTLENDETCLCCLCVLVCARPWAPGSCTTPPLALGCSLSRGPRPERCFGTLRLESQNTSKQPACSMH